jgi:transcriptional regulator with XRE-family HTH domain
MDFKEEREKLYLTQEEFALKIGMSKQQYCRYERGAKMRLSTRKKIEEKFRELKGE